MVRQWRSKTMDRTFDMYFNILIARLQILAFHVIHHVDLEGHTKADSHACNFAR